jgi:hypothetical protein
MASSIAQVEPLPFVPATLITGTLNFSCRRSTMTVMRASVMSISFGCRRRQWSSHSGRVVGKVMVEWLTRSDRPYRRCRSHAA